MKRIFLSMGIAIFLVALMGYANGMNQNLSDDLLRMHVIANSDSERDQELKLEVRDAVIKTANSLLPKGIGKEEAKAIILMHQDLLLKSAKEVLEREGCSDPVTLSYGKTYFPEKTYAGLSLPSGEYDAFRFQIGQAKGKNWWCVMYPSFGSPAEELLDEESMLLLKQQLSPEEYDLITSDHPSVVLRFKTVDYLMKIKEKIKTIGSEL